VNIREAGEVLYFTVIAGSYELMITSFMSFGTCCLWMQYCCYIRDVYEISRSIKEIMHGIATRADVRQRNDDISR